MMLGMNVLMLGVHYAIQTENPIETRIVPTFASQSLENVFIFKMLMGKRITNKNRCLPQRFFLFSLTSYQETTTLLHAPPVPP